MFNLNISSKITNTLAVLLLFVAGISIAVADQVTISYVDINYDAQTLSIDLNSSAADLALAAALLSEVGVSAIHEPDNGSGTLAEMAAAMATAAPLFAADIVLALATLSPEDVDAIVAAVNAVPGVNTTAVRVAVHCSEAIPMAGVPPEASLMTCLSRERDHVRAGLGSTISLELTQIEPVPSRN